MSASACLRRRIEKANAPTSVRRQRCDQPVPTLQITSNMSGFFFFFFFFLLASGSVASFDVEETFFLSFGTVLLI